MTIKGLSSVRTRVQQLKLANPSLSALDIADRLGVTRGTVYRHLAALELPTNPSDHDNRRTIKFDDKLYVRIKAAAARESMYINDWIAYAVEQHLNQGQSNDR